MISLDNSGALTLSFRQATQAVIFRDISGIFLSPNDSRSAITADSEAMLSIIMESYGKRWFEDARMRR